MRSTRDSRRSLGLALLFGLAAIGAARAQEPSFPPPQPGPSAEAVPGQSNSNESAVTPVHEGPLHEAFLSPARDVEPVHLEKGPPPPIVERPGIDPPSPDARWIDGYWDWDPSRNDFIWVTGTWRVPPPGRFWVNGFWKRDDKGWYRVAGFWSERRTDRIDFRKNGPPTDHPDDEPGPAPGKDYFYVPGQYVPDGDGVVWKKGFWAKAQPGWAWVPAQWVKQPEGWVFQEGYWDRTLEDRGILFTPAEVADKSNTQNLVYQPLSQIAPSSYGRLYGALGRPTPYYDGYPGCYYDPYGQYYGYANYGTIGLYTGYLDYPYTGYVGYPYLTTAYSYGYGSPYSYYNLGYSYLGGLGCGIGGLGYGFGYGYPYYGYGYGYPGFGTYGLLGGLFGRMFGGLGLGFGYGFPYYGLGGFGFGYPYYGYGFGYPYYGFGSFGFGYPFLSGFGFPFFGGFGFPFFGGFGFPFFGSGFRHHRNYHHYPFYPGHGQHWAGNGGRGSWGGMGGMHRGGLGTGSGMPIQRPTGGSQLLRNPGLASGGSRLLHHGRTMPAANSPFANPLLSSAHTRHASGPVGPNVTPGFNAGQRQVVHHTVARPAFGSSHGGAMLNATHRAGQPALGGLQPGGPALGSAAHRGGLPGATGGLNGLGNPGHAGGLSATNRAPVITQGHGNGGVPAQGANRLGGVAGVPHNAAPGRGLAMPGPHAQGGQNLILQGQHHAALGSGLAGHQGAIAQPRVGSIGGHVGQPLLGGGYGGLPQHHVGGIAPQVHSMGGFAAPSMHHMGGVGGMPLGGFGGAHHGGAIGGMPMGGFGGGHVGGFGGGHMGGFGGGHMGGMGHMGGGFGGGHGGGHH